MWGLDRRPGARLGADVGRHEQGRLRRGRLAAQGRVHGYPERPAQGAGCLGTARAGRAGHRPWVRGAGAGRSLGQGRYQVARRCV